jgi:acetoacetyl-CoA reductase
LSVPDGANGNGNGNGKGGARHWVLVTGGSRGIGRAICLAFADSGENVAFFYLQNHEAAGVTAAALRERGVEARPLCVDVSDHTAVSAAFEAMESEHLEIDVLVNCAGITLDRSLPKLSHDLWSRVIDTNLTGCFNCSQGVVSNMRDRNYGRIVNISSIIAQTGNVGQGNYSAAKAGMIGLTKSLALETARYDITVNAVCPGFVDTEMVQAVPQEIREQIIERIPKHRFGLPEEVARLVTFIAAPDSGYITGQQFNVNGGLYM